MLPLSRLLRLLAPVLAVLAIGAQASLADTFGQISGLVRDSSGRVLAGASVRLSLGGLSDSARTDAEGVYRFTSVPAASGYSLRATARKQTPAEMAGLSVTAGQNLHVDFALSPAGRARGGAILGVVRGPDGRAVRGARVEVLVGATDARTTTDRQGRFRLKELTPGAYSLSVTSPSLAAEVLDSVAVSRDRTAQVRVDLEEPDGAAPGAIFGVVRDQDGHALPGAIIEVVSGPTDVETSAGVEGRYELSGLAAGTYAVRASAAGYWGNTWDGILVTAGHSVRVDFALRRANDGAFGAILGTVTDGEGHALRGAVVEVVDGPTHRRAETGEDGRYHLPELSAGAYLVRAAKDGYESLTHDASVTAGGTTTLNFTLARRTIGRIIGHVNSAAGEALSGVTVRIVEGPQALTGPLGGYEIENVPAGEYTLRASKDGFRTAVKEHVVVHAGEATVVDWVLEREAPAFGRIVGRVTDLEGHAIAEAKVRITQGPVIREVFTNGEGRYALEELPAGVYRLAASRAGFQTAEAGPVEVGAGQVKEVNFSLRRSFGQIQGVVRSAAGEPLHEVLVQIIGGDRHTYTDHGEYHLRELLAGTYSARYSRPGYRTVELSGVAVEAGGTTTRHVTMEPAE